MSIPVFDAFSGGRMALLLGLLGAALAALFTLAPWSLALLCGFAVLMVSAAENEPFLLLVIFLTPVGWFIGKTDLLVSAFPSRSNIDAALLIRCVVIVGFFLGRLWRGQFEIKRQFRPALAKASLAFAAAALISAVLSEPDLRLASMIRVDLRAVAYLGFFFFMLAWCGSQERIERIVRVLLTSALVAAVFGIVQVAVGGYTLLWYYLYPLGSETFPWDSRATSFLDYPNDLASYLNLILPLALACYAVGGPEWRNLGAWTFVVGSAALVCTQSRGGMLGFGCMLVAGIFLLVEKLRTRILSLGTTASLGIVLYLAVIAPGKAHLGVTDLYTAATRLFLWGVAWQLFTGSPIHGVGWGNFQVLYGAYLDPSLLAESQLGVHNTYLALLAETGLLGFLAFMILVVLGFRAAYDHFRTSQNSFGRSLGFGVMGAMVAMVVQGFVEFQIAFTQFGVLFWMLLGLLVASASLQRKSVVSAAVPSGPGA